MIYTVARELPGTLSTMAAPQGDLDVVLPTLRAYGVDTLVSLLPPEQVSMLFLTDEPNAAYRAGLAFRSLPVPDFGVPDYAEFAQPLRELSDELTAGRHVAVHCWGGVGRSSLVAAALLVLRGSTAEAAWHRVAYARGVPVPETDEQRDWIDVLEQLGTPVPGEEY
jgi:protein-tyrosine phosphatase